MTGAALHRDVMEEESRKSHAKWNMSSGTGSLREAGDGEPKETDKEDWAWRCLAPVGIPALSW